MGGAIVRRYEVPWAPHYGLPWSGSLAMRGYGSPPSKRLLGADYLAEMVPVGDGSFEQRSPALVLSVLEDTEWDDGLALANVDLIIVGDETPLSVGGMALWQVWENHILSFLAGGRMVHAFWGVWGQIKAAP